RIYRAENSDVLLGEFEIVGHVIIERRAKPRVEGVNKKKRRDYPKGTQGQASQQSNKGPFHLAEIDAALLLVDQKPAGTDDEQWGGDNNRSGAVQCRGGRQSFDQLTANESAGHCGNVEPQPLLIDEQIGGAELLAILDENGAAY